MQVASFAVVRELDDAEADSHQGDRQAVD